MADYISQFTGSEIDQRLAKVPQLESGKQDKLVSGSNIKTINGESVLGSGNITVQGGDTDAVKYVEQTLTEVQKAQALANIGGASAESVTAETARATAAEEDIMDAMDGTNVETVTVLPAASASTVGKFYYVGPDGNGEYARYRGIESGGTYSFLPVGTTEMNLSTYATKAEVDELEAKVDELATGKFYGFRASAQDLPEGDAVGYAFVGTENPYAIWNFDGEEWGDSGSVVNGITGEPGVGFSSIFTPDPYDGTVIIVLSNNDTITLDLNHNHPAYYSKVAETSNPSGGFLPDVVYSLGTLTGTVTFALAAAVTGNVNHYFWMFDTSSTAPTITWPAGITWAAGSAPTVAASKHYEISVLGGIAYYSEV